ncbi:hypothetical protein FOCC_FOCC006230 [Frankliniella occidentalis]|nr:hypothetical protein FOCC_FOCC006230 [Frankliniella occidentalis]
MSSVVCFSIASTFGPATMIHPECLAREHSPVLLQDDNAPRPCADQEAHCAHCTAQGGSKHLDPAPKAEGAGDENEASDCEAAVDAAGIGFFSFGVMCTAGLTYLTCGLQWGISAYILPAARCDFDLTSAQMGAINAFFMAGGMASSYVWGVLGDVLGRRPVIVFALLADAASTLCSTFVQSYAAFAFFRCLSGFLIGSPSALTFLNMSEFVPARVRATYSLIVGAFWTVSWILLPGLAWLVLPQTWQCWADELRDLELLEADNGSSSSAADMVGSPTCNVDEAINETVFVKTLIISTVCLVAYVVTAPLASRVGRRALPFFLNLGSGILAAAIYFVNSTTSNLVVASLFQAFVGTANTAILSILADIFPTRVSAVGVCSAVFAGRVSAAVSNIVMGSLLDISCEVPIFLISGSAIVSGLLSILVQPPWLANSISPPLPLGDSSSGPTLKEVCEHDVQPYRPKTTLDIYVIGVTRSPSASRCMRT